MGVLACLFPILLVFFPDEKLVRLKLEAIELLAWAGLTLWGVRAFYRGHFSLRALWPWTQTSSVLLWLLVMGGLGIYSTEKSVATMELRRVVLSATLFICAAHSGLSREWHRRVINVWGIGASLLAFYSLLQKTGGIGFLQVPQMDRVMGTFGNPIFLAAFLNVSLFMTAGAFSQQRSDGGKIGAGAGILIQWGALYFTQTRAAWLAFLGAAVLLLFIRLRFKTAVGWAALLAGAGLVFGWATFPVWVRDQAHLLIWRDTLRMWLHHPFGGVGLGAFHIHFPTYAQPDLLAKWPAGQFIINEAHNEYLQMLAEGGLLSLGAFLGVIGPWIFSGFQRRSSLSVGRGEPFFPWWIWGAGMSLLIQNLFSVDMRFGVSLAMLFFLMGLSEASQQIPMAPARPQVRTSAHPKAARTRGPGKMILALVWVLFMGMVVLPALLHPYRAQKEVRAQKDFFDQRLLNPAQTIGELDVLAQRHPGEPLVWERLAYAYAKEIKTAEGKTDPIRVNQAIEAYSRVLKLKPDSVGAANNLGNIYFTVGQTDQALAMWEKTVQIDPDFMDAHLNLGKVLYTQGRLKESARHFEIVLKRDPRNAEATVYLKRMVE